MNREAWIWIKLQCVIYQWICLNMLYKLNKSLFPIIFRINYVESFKIIVALVLCMQGVGGICADQHTF